MRQRHPRLAGVYAITDERLTPAETILDQVATVLRGGCRIVQYRDKSADHHRRLQEARALRALCESRGARLVINDDVELARAARAHGVHIGQQDCGLDRARECLGRDAVIGVTCHDSLELALAAEAGGADYVAFGALFTSSTKPRARRAPLALLTEARRRLALPICAIGGIETSNAAQVIAAGADMIAVVGGVFGQPDPEAAARGLQGLFPAA